MKHYTSSEFDEEEEEKETVCSAALSRLRKNSHDKFWVGAAMKHYRSFKLSMPYSNHSIVSGNIHGQYGRFAQRPVEDIVFGGTVEILVPGADCNFFLTDLDESASRDKLSAVRLEIRRFQIVRRGLFEILSRVCGKMRRKISVLVLATLALVFLHSRARSVFKTTRVYIYIYIRTSGEKKRRERVEDIANYSDAESI